MTEGAAVATGEGRPAAGGKAAPNVPRTSCAELAKEHLTTASTMYRETGMALWLTRVERDELS